MKTLHRSRLALIALLLMLCTLFASCDITINFPGQTESTTPQATTPITTPEPDKDESTTPSDAGSQTTPPSDTGSQTTPPSDPGSQTTPSQSFHYEDVPAYSGELYAEINGNVPYFDEDDYTTKSYEDYADLDSLKRCGVAMACLGRDLMPTSPRGDISGVTPSGWVQATYDIVNGKYLYNRSHLIGWQLAGENANEKNLITGTRSFNQLGMLPFENMVADYIKETNNHVLYRVTPVFVGSELVARGALIEAWSVEDDGDGICFCVFVYNAQSGIEIDYATGKSHLENEEEQEPNTPDEGEKHDYIANKNSKKFHYPDCSSVSKMSDKNKLYITATHDEMIADGYTPCGICNP